MAVRYLLDTNTCIYIAKHNPPAVRESFARPPPATWPCRWSPLASYALALKRVSPN